MDYDNTANLTVEGKVESTQESITLDAKAQYPIDTFKTSASVGQGFVARFIGETIGTKYMSQDIMDKLGSWVNGWFKKNNANYSESLAKKLADYIKVGITFAYMDNGNASNLTIGHRANLKAGKNINVSSKAAIDDLFTYALGASINSEEYHGDDSTNSTILANGAIFLRTVNNDSNLIVTTGNQETGAVIAGGGTITLDSQALMPYNRVNNTIMKALTDLGILSDNPQLWGNATEEDMAVLKKYYNAAMAKKAEIEGEVYDADGQLKPEYADEQSNSDALMQKMEEYYSSEEYKQYVELLSTGKYTDDNGVEHSINVENNVGFTTLLSDVVNAVNPQNYFSYSVASEVSTRTTAKDPYSSEFGIGIAFGYDTLKTNARALVGDSAQISGGGDVNINAKADYADIVVNGGYLWDTAGTKGSNIDVVTISSLDNNKALVATGDITIESGRSIYLSDAAFKLSSELAGKGYTFVKGIQAGGNVTIRSSSIYNSMSITAQGNISLEAKAEWDSSNPEVGVVKIYDLNGQFISKEGDITITADGYTTVDDYKNSLLQEAITEQFSIRNLGNNDLIAQKGKVTLNGAYAIENVGDIQAGGDVNLIAGTNIYNYEYGDALDIDLEEGICKTNTSGRESGIPHSITSGGTITWKAQKVYNVAGQYAQGDINIDLDTYGANIKKITSKQNLTLTQTDPEGEVTFISSIFCDGNISFDVAGTLLLGEEAVVSAGKNLVLNADKGVTTKLALEAGEDITITSEEGTVNIQKSMTNKNGKLSISAGEGTISVTGSIASEVMDVNLGAKEEVRVNGNIAAKRGLAALGSWEEAVNHSKGTIAGNEVIIYTENPEVTMIFDQLSVGNELTLAGNKWENLMDDDGYLDMTRINAMSNDYSLNLFSAGRTNDGANYKLKYGVSTEHINLKAVVANSLEIITDAPITIQDLSVSERADIYAMGTKTAVYGQLQTYDEDAKVIYYAPGKGAGAYIDLHDMFFEGTAASYQEVMDEFKADSSQFMTGGNIAGVDGRGTGMYLDIRSAEEQTGTGILLRNYYGQHTYNQRLSVEQIMQHLLSFKAQDLYNSYFHVGGIDFYPSYNLIQIPDVVVNSSEVTEKELKWEF